jgi:hypothetical protein
MLGEMVADYQIGVKRAIIDYVLRSPRECRRVNILYPPPSVAIDWGRDNQYVTVSREHANNDAVSLNEVSDLPIRKT